METRTKPHRRLLALWFPYLSTDRLARRERGRHWLAGGLTHGLDGEEEMPARIVTASIQSAYRIVAMNRQARKLGLTLGQSLADARALHPKIDVVEEDREADHAILEQIANWADRYTPLVALDQTAAKIRFDGPIPNIFRHGLYLDMTGCVHLFEGQCRGDETPETAFMRDVKEQLMDQGFHVRMAFAGTIGMAWAASRFQNGAVLTPGSEKEALAPMPLSALRLDPKIESAMDRVGLKKIGQILDQPSAPLASRFGLDLMRNLNRALGHEDESISPRLTPPALMAERRFHEPISLSDDVERAIHSLAETLAITLESRGEGARALETVLFHTDGNVTRATIATAKGLTAPAAIRRLFKDKLGDELERFQARMGEAATGFDMIRLNVLASDKVNADQKSFEGENSHDVSQEFAHLIDKLAVRLGGHNVMTLTRGDSHQPELAQYPETAQIQPPLKADWHGEDVTRDPRPPSRPIRLLQEPEEVSAIAEIPEGPPLRFRWRRALHSVTKVDGPERISADWWNLNAKPRLTRDYYRVEDDTGHRYWLYRDGLYGEAVTPEPVTPEHRPLEPNWYVHGIFA